MPSTAHGRSPSQRLVDVGVDPTRPGQRDEHATVGPGDDDSARHAEPLLDALGHPRGNRGRVETSRELSGHRPQLLEELIGRGVGRHVRGGGGGRSRSAYPGSEQAQAEGEQDPPRQVPKVGRIEVVEMSDDPDGTSQSTRQDGTGHSCRQPGREGGDEEIRKEADRQGIGE